MAEKGSNNWLWWSIGGIATLGLGLGIYYYVKSKKEQEQEQNKNETKPAPTPTPTPSPITTQTTTPPPATTYPQKSTPFTSVEQSNAFRAWVNQKDPSFAKEIGLEMNLKNPNTMNNETIQKAWAKFSEHYYTTNANALGYPTRLATGSSAINGGMQWTSTSGVPRGEITMYTDGKITANAVNAQGAQTKFVQGGWYINGLTFNLMIGGANYSVGLFGLQNEFWNILKKAGIFNETTQSYSAFVNADGRGASVFGVNGGEGGIAQDMML